MVNGVNLVNSVNSVNGVNGVNEVNGVNSVNLVNSVNSVNGRTTTGRGQAGDEHLAHGWNGGRAHLTTTIFEKAERSARLTTHLYIPDGAFAVSIVWLRIPASSPATLRS